MRLENKYSDNPKNSANLFAEFFSSILNVPKVVDSNIFLNSNEIVDFSNYTLSIAEVFVYFRSIQI
jgi:hypothetical protein